MFLGVKGGWPGCKADNLTAICEPIVYQMWEPRRLTTLWASTACYRDNFTFYLLFRYVMISASNFQEEAEIEFRLNKILRRIQETLVITYE
jgi:hypothetical protein